MCLVNTFTSYQIFWVGEDWNFVAVHIFYWQFFCFSNSSWTGLFIVSFLKWYKYLACLISATSLKNHWFLLYQWEDIKYRASPFLCGAFGQVGWSTKGKFFKGQDSMLLCTSGEDLNSDTKTYWIPLIMYYMVRALLHVFFVNVWTFQFVHNLRVQVSWRQPSRMSAAYLVLTNGHQNNDRIHGPHVTQSYDFSKY